MVIYSYVVARDYGFAPNPFNGYCTLATCKPLIRKNAKIGDWVIGTGSAGKKSKFLNKLIYAMIIKEIMPFNDYWNDVRFIKKRPVLNGSKKQAYGDNIYHIDPKTRKFKQENSHHSLPNGGTNKKNYHRDISGKYVLIAEHFWYFGNEAILIPSYLRGIIKSRQGHKKISDKPLEDKLLKRKFINWIEKHEKKGYIGRPAMFSGEFERYKG